MFTLVGIIIYLIKSRSSVAAPPVQINCISGDHVENIGLHSWNPSPLDGGILITLCIAIITCGPVESCQHGFTRHAADIVCSQGGVCTYEFSRELLFNRIQNEQCIEIRHENRPVGLLKMRVRSITLKCAKVSKFFTKSTEHKVYTSVRCAQAGSCTGNVCDTLGRNDTVPELSRARKYPGYSGCQYTCGGVSCGCFLLSPACTFYKVAHIPISRAVFEVIECREWIPDIQVELESTLMKENKEETLLLEPYMTSTFHNFNITAVSVQKPSLAILTRRFAVSRNTSVLLPDQFVVPVECPTRLDAVNNFRNCANKVICDCNTGWTKHHCHCPDNTLRKVAMDDGHKLPLITPSVEIHSTEDGIVAFMTDIETIITVQSKLLLGSTSFTQEEKCYASLDQLTGCYSCIQGAVAISHCETKDPTTITVHCDHHSFSIECGPSNPETKVKFSIDTAVVKYNCFTYCGSEKVMLSLNGTLKYHTLSYESVFHFNHDSYREPTWMESLASIQLPDLHPLVEIARAHWKSALGAVTVTVVLSVLSYLFGPVILITLAKVAFALCKTTIHLLLWVFSMIWRSTKSLRNMKEHGSQ